MGMLYADRGEYDIEVEPTLLTPEEGGRKVGLHSASYHDHFYIDGFHWIARYDMQDREILNLGETAGLRDLLLCPSGFDRATAPRQTVPPNRSWNHRQRRHSFSAPF